MTDGRSGTGYLSSHCVGESLRAEDWKMIRTTDQQMYTLAAANPAHMLKSPKSHDSERSSDCISCGWRGNQRRQWRWKRRGQMRFYTFNSSPSDDSESTVVTLFSPLISLSDSKAKEHQPAIHFLSITVFTCYLLFSPSGKHWSSSIDCNFQKITVSFGPYVIFSFLS